MNTRIQDLVEKTERAYSFDNYSEKSWGACIKLLCNRGYNDLQIEAIMRSKHTRWAHNMSGKNYGNTTSKDLERYLDRNPRYFTEAEVAKLVAETFSL